jgi:hypothetical protein
MRKAWIQDNSFRKIPHDEIFFLYSPPIDVLRKSTKKTEYTSSYVDTQTIKMPDSTDSLISIN